MAKLYLIKKTPPAGLNINGLELGKGHLVLGAFLGQAQVAALDAELGDKHIHINMVYVRPPFRQQGIASAMLDYLSSTYSDKQISNLRIHLPKYD